MHCNSNSVIYLPSDNETEYFVVIALLVLALIATAAFVIVLKRKRIARAMWTVDQEDDTTGASSVSATK